MKPAARNRAGIKSFVVCFYCNETFRKLSSLLQHRCSAEEKTSLEWESHESLSDTNDVDLSQVDWELNASLADASNCDLAEQDSVISESVSEKPIDIREEITEADSITNHISENLSPETKTNEQTLSKKKSDVTEQEITDLASNAPGEQLLEGNLDIIREVTESFADAFEKQSPEENLDIIEFLESSSNALEKQLLEGNLDVEREKSSDSSSEVCEKHVLKGNLNVRKENTELVSEKPSDIRQEITEAESNTNISENLLPQTKTEYKQTLSEKLNAAKQEIADLASDPPEKQLLEGNLNVVKENTESSSEEQLSEGNSDVVKEVIDPASDAPMKPLPVPNSDSEQRNTEVESNADCTIPVLASTVLQYYEKQTKHDISNSCYKSSSTEVEFHASHLPLPEIETGSPRHETTQMECSTNGICNKVLSSETKCEAYAEDIIQKESGIVKENVRGLQFHNSNSFSRMSSSEVNSSDMLSRSSSVETDLDSLGYGDDQAKSDDSDVCSSVNISENKSHTLNHDQMQIESHTSETRNKTLTEENFKIKMYGSVVLKPCYVKIEDIFESIAKSKLSPRKIFSRKKNYHVCNVCTKFFRSKTDLNIHHLTHSTEKPYKCHKCGKSFVKQNNLFAHHFIHTIKKKHSCSICNRPFLTKIALQKHKLAHISKKPFPCDKCNKSYCSKASLTEHYFSHSDERPFVCEICNYSFKNKRYLIRHYYRHKQRHSQKENVCEFCYKVFKRVHHLDEHYNIHLNNRPHECKICGKSFYLLLTLNHHYFNVHKKAKNPEFHESVKTMKDCKGSKDPIIQKIEKSAIISNSEKTAVQKIEEIDNNKCKETFHHVSRRKSSNPKKYLYSDSFVL